MNSQIISVPYENGNGASLQYLRRSAESLRWRWFPEKDLWKVYNELSSEQKKLIPNETAGEAVALLGKVIKKYPNLGRVVFDDIHSGDNLAAVPSLLYLAHQGRDKKLKYNKNALALHHPLTVNEVICNYCSRAFGVPPLPYEILFYCNHDTLEDFNTTYEQLREFNEAIVGGLVGKASYPREIRDIANPDIKMIKKHEYKRKQIADSGFSFLLLELFDGIDGLVRSGEQAFDNLLPMARSGKHSFQWSQNNLKERHENSMAIQKRAREIRNDPLMNPRKLDALKFAEDIPVLFARAAFAYVRALETVGREKFSLPEKLAEDMDEYCDWRDIAVSAYKGAVARLRNSGRRFPQPAHAA